MQYHFLKYVKQINKLRFEKPMGVCSEKISF